MNHHSHHHSWLFNHWSMCWLVAVALQLILIALCILLTGRPLVLSQRWSLCPMLAPLLLAIAILFDRPSWGTLWAMPILLVFPFLWLRVRGAVVLGATNARFQEAWQDALRVCHYTSEEGLGNECGIAETGARLRVTPPGLLGVGGIVALERNGAPTMKLLVHGMKQSFATYTRSIYLAGALIHLLMGVGLLGFGFWIWPYD